MIRKLLVLQNGIYSFQQSCERKSQMIKQKQCQRVWTGMVLAPVLLVFLSALLGHSSKDSLCPESIIKGKIRKIF